MTDQHLDALLEEWSRGNKLRLDAYYYGFEHTGCLAIDRVLSAVAISGKWYHNTEDWNQVSGHGVSASELIQAAAERSAKELENVLGPDASGRRLSELLLEASRLLSSLGNGPLADCLSEKAEAISAAEGST